MSHHVWRLIPRTIRRLLTTIPGWIRWGSSSLRTAPPRDRIGVYYGRDHIPDSNELSHGGAIKLQYLQQFFPNSPRSFNFLYAVSSALPRDWLSLIWLIKKQNLRMVWNQDGVAYPGWHGPGWEAVNKPMIRMLHAADYVLYQSEFCKLGADRFLGKRVGPWRILYNPTDTKFFVPAKSDPDPRHLVLLSVGSFQAFYRFESAVATLARVARFRQNVRLIVAGRLVWDEQRKKVFKDAYRLIDQLNVRDKVILLPPYTQAEAPLIYQRAHVLVHTKYNDPCPTVVIEAMASGLPVVYSGSGGVPELVGNEAGTGVPADLSWDKDIPPDPQLMAEAVLRVAERQEEYSQAARQRATERFDVYTWLEAHREVFSEVWSADT